MCAILPASGDSGEGEEEKEVGIGSDRFDGGGRDDLW